MYPRTVAEAKRAHQILGVESSIFLDIPALQLDAQVPGRLNAELSALVERLRPDLVLAPFADRHVDHVATLNSVLVATRPISAGRDIAVLAMYEVISSTHWTVPGLEASFTPTWFVDISSSINMKIAAMAAYESQLQEFPSARSIPALEALACFRGSQIGVEAAEAFQVVRMISKAGTAQLPSNIVAEGR